MAIFGVRGTAGGRSAALLLLILACSSEQYTSPCVAFLLPAIAKPVARSRTAPSAVVTHRCKSVSSSSSSSKHAGFSQVPSLSFSALAASGDGADAGPSGSSADIFDALMAGDMDFVTEYVKSGGDCSVQDSIGDTPLMLAVESELTSAVRLLINEGGARANLASETTGETPLMLAAYYGHTNLARILINEGGAELELRNKKGDTALGLACFWGNEDTVEYLLEAGCDPNSRNNAGERPGDKFDAVFVPDTVENFFTADAESDRENATSSSDDAVDDDDDEEDIMFDDLDGGGDTSAASGGDGEEKSEGSEGVPPVGGDAGDDVEPAEELQGPRAAILAMLEEARAKAAA